MLHERREQIPDLELGKQHMQEMMEKLLPLVNLDAEANQRFNELRKQVDNIQRAEDLKLAYDQMQDMMRGITAQRRKDVSEADLRAIEQLQKQLEGLGV